MRKNLLLLAIALLMPLWQEDRDKVGTQSDFYK